MANGGNRPNRPLRPRGGGGAGGRGLSASSGSSNTSGSASSSSACLIVTSRSSSAAISWTSSSVSDCVAVFIVPRFISSLMICGMATPSACEKSRSVTPDSTVAGPVGAATSRGWRGPRSAGRSLGRWRCPVPGRPPPPSMTTRRRPFGPPPRGLIGLFGLPLAIWSGSSVETGEIGVDAHGSAQDAVERSARRCPLEARQAPTRVNAASVTCAGDQ